MGEEEDDRVEDQQVHAASRKSNYRAELSRERRSRPGLLENLRKSRFFSGTSSIFNNVESDLQELEDYVQRLEKHTIEVESKANGTGEGLKRNWNEMNQIHDFNERESQGDLLPTVRSDTDSSELQHGYDSDEGINTMLKQQSEMSQRSVI